MSISTTIILIVSISFLFVFFSFLIKLGIEDIKSKEMSIGVMAITIGSCGLMLLFYHLTLVLIRILI